MRWKWTLRPLSPREVFQFVYVHWIEVVFAAMSIPFTTSVVSNVSRAVNGRYDHYHLVRCLSPREVFQYWIEVVFAAMSIPFTTSVVSNVSRGENGWYDHYHLARWKWTLQPLSPREVFQFVYTLNWSGICRNVYPFNHKCSVKRIPRWLAE